MSGVRRVTHATATSGSEAPAFRVDLAARAHRLSADEPRGAGGGDAGPTPFELLLCGLAACTVITLRMYADRKGWPLASIDVDVRHKVPEDGDAWIERTITLPDDLPQQQRDRLADIAERTPVTLAVRAGTPITTTIASRGTAA